MHAQNSYRSHDLPTLDASDPLGAGGHDGDDDSFALPMPSLHPRDVDQTVRRIRGLTKRATEMVCGGECGVGLFDVVSCHSAPSRFLEQVKVIHMSKFGRTACTRTPY